jgi:tetratricopeptide (TPR) repeat protein
MALAPVEAPKRSVSKIAWLAGTSFLFIALTAGWSAWVDSRAQALWDEAHKARSRGDYETAERALQRRAWYLPGDVKAMAFRSDVALRRGDNDAALYWLAQIPPHSPAAQFAYLKRAKLLMEFFRPKAADAEFRRVLRLIPTMTDARWSLIVIYGVQRRAAEQESQLWELSRQADQRLEALRLLAQGRVVIPADSLGGLPDEGKVLESCLKAEPDNPHLRPALAYFYRNRGEVQRAIDLLDSWVASNPDDGDAATELAACYLDQGTPEPAAKLLEPPRGSQKIRARYWSLRADWLERVGRPNEAVDAARRAIELAPRDPELHYRLGQTLRAAGKSDEAQVWLKKAEAGIELRKLAANIPMKPDDTGPILEMADACKALGRDREARAWYNVAIQLEPENERARKGLRRDDEAPGEASS